MKIEIDFKKIENGVVATVAIVDCGDYPTISIFPLEMGHNVDLSGWELGKTPAPRTSAVTQALGTSTKANNWADEVVSQVRDQLTCWREKSLSVSREVII